MTTPDLTPVAYDSIGAPLYKHQLPGREMFECPDCSSLYVSPIAAAECCSPMWERGIR